jgi:hypothetical protein
VDPATVSTCALAYTGTKFSPPTFVRAGMPVVKHVGHVKRNSGCITTSMKMRATSVRGRLVASSRS